MTHKSRLGCVVIDCKANDLSQPFRFWGAALGLEGNVDDDGKYCSFATQGDDLRVLLQAVDHDSRVHVDIETDDKEAEARRLESLGAKRIASIKSWIVMEAPTGHRFCVVNPQRLDFESGATVWNDDGTRAGKDL